MIARNSNVQLGVLGRTIGKVAWPIGQVEVSVSVGVSTWVGQVASSTVVVVELNPEVVVLGLHHGVTHGIVGDNALWCARDGVCMVRIVREVRSQSIDEIAQVGLGAVVVLNINIPAVDEGVAEWACRVAGVSWVGKAVPERVSHALCIACAVELVSCTSSSDANEDLLAVGLASINILGHLLALGLCRAIGVDQTVSYIATWEVAISELIEESDNDDVDAFATGTVAS